MAAILSRPQCANQSLAPLGAKTRKDSDDYGMGY